MNTSTSHGTPDRPIDEALFGLSVAEAALFPVPSGLFALFVADFEGFGLAVAGSLIGLPLSPKTSR